MKNIDPSLFSKVPPFRKLDREQIDEIFDLSTRKFYPAEKAIFSEGFPADRFFLLLDGCVRVIRTTPSGEQVIVLHIVSGELFGIALALGHQAYPATAVSVSDCLVLSWPNGHWHPFVAKYDGFATETYKVVGKRLKGISGRVMEMATKNVEQRIACALLELIKQVGRETEEGIEINVPVTRQNIADMTGTTLHTVSRLLSTWEKDGIVRSTRKRIRVTRPDRVALLGEES